MTTDFQSTQPFSRRLFLKRSVSLAAIAGWSLDGLARSPTGKGTLKIGLTPVFLDDQIGFITRWKRWFEEKLDQPVSFLQRGNYREVVDLLLTGKIDFAWLCGYPYVRHKGQMRLVAVPLWHGRPQYQSYLIVSDASKYRNLTDLRGKIFAYSDPDSNSGFLYPQFVLRSQGENPVQYFSRTFFTWSHRNVVQAISEGLADGGAVDGYVWETLAQTRPNLTRGTRVIDKSPFLGFPPFVARRDIPETELRLLRAALLGMAADSKGAGLLGNLGLDGFTPGNTELFSGIQRMVEKVRSS